MSDAAAARPPNPGMSIRALVTLAIAAMALAPIGLGTYMLVGALAQHEEAARVLGAAGVARQLGTVAIESRLERVNALLGLVASAPAAPGGALAGNRARADAALAASLPTLRQIGRGPQADRLAAAHGEVVRLRAALDAALQLAAAQREPGLDRRWAGISADLIEKVVAVIESVEDSMRLRDAVTDHLIAMRRAGTAVRIGLGGIIQELLNILSGTGAPPVEQLMAARFEAGRAEQSWAQLRQLKHAARHARGAAPRRAGRRADGIGGAGANPDGAARRHGVGAAAGGRVSRGCATARLAGWPC